MPDNYFSHNEYTFVWDAEKAELNFKKHGITFQTAARVFDDELRLELPDIKHSDTEERYITIGLVYNILTVVYCDRLNETTGNVDIRMISARVATRMEQVMYNNNLIGRV
ncbi:MAG: BrnT family toxin [Clostridia bacterium]|nr:BrnT family toxin [Clostridia bacterium]